MPGRCRALLRRPTEGLGVSTGAISRCSPRSPRRSAHVAQVFRVRRERTDLKSGEYSVEYAYGNSLAAASATPQQLLA